MVQNDSTRNWKGPYIWHNRMRSGSLAWSLPVRSWASGSWCFSPPLHWRRQWGLDEAYSSLLVPWLDILTLTSQLHISRSRRWTEVMWVFIKCWTSKTFLRRLLCDPAHKELQKQFPKTTEGPTGPQRCCTCVHKGLSGSPRPQKQITSQRGRAAGEGQRRKVLTNLRPRDGAGMPRA